ncbi:MAG: hypothetical protein AB7T06_39900 [Kofleriaceae bacterium]
MHVIKGKRRMERTNQDDVVSRATGRMQAQKLIDLIDESAPDEGVVDVHALDMKFADGTRRIEVAPPEEEGAVVAIVEGAADTTRRMSAVEWDAAVAAACAVESEVHSESTMRMSAIQANQLAALITPVEVSLVDETHEPIAPALVQEPIITFTTPRLSQPLPAANEGADVSVETASAVPRRGANRWMIAAMIALAGAAAGLAAVALSYV